jgi:multiple antibiotic resistance protein
MLGPIKILVPFAEMTKDSDWRARLGLACRSVLFSFAIIAFALTVGGMMLARLEISLPSLALIGSVVLILVACRTIFQLPSNNLPAAVPTVPIYSLALTPLAFPVIVTPFGIAALIVLKQLATIQQRETALFLIVAIILALNLVAMAFAEFIVKWASVPLYIFAVVLALIQASLGLQIALRSLAVLKLLPPGAL